MIFLGIILGLIVSVMFVMLLLQMRHHGQTDAWHKRAEQLLMSLHNSHDEDFTWLEKKIAKLVKEKNG